MLTPPPFKPLAPSTILVCLDVDGTLLQTEEYRQRFLVKTAERWMEGSPKFVAAVKDHCAKADIPFDPEARKMPEKFFRFTLGLGRDQILAELGTRCGLSLDEAAKFMKERDTALAAFEAAGGKIPLKPGALRGLRALNELGVKVGVNTQSSREEVISRFGKFGILQFIDLDISVFKDSKYNGADIKKKPASDSWDVAVDLAKAKFGSDAAEIRIACEDSPAGYQSAKTAPGWIPVHVQDIAETSPAWLTNTVSSVARVVSFVGYLVGKGENPWKGLEARQRLSKAA